MLRLEDGRAETRELVLVAPAAASIELATLELEAGVRADRPAGGACAADDPPRSRHGVRIVPGRPAAQALLPPAPFR